MNQVLADNSLQLAAVLLTHGHVDHCGDAAALANEHEVPVFMHSGDRAWLTHPALGLGAGTEAMLAEMGCATLPEPRQLELLDSVRDLQLAGIEFTVTPAPGHSPGCVLFRVADQDGPIVFTGDVVFQGSIGRTDLPGGDMSVMRDSLRDTILGLPDDTRLLSGHGPGTTMGVERGTNPYLQTSFLEATF